MRGTIKVIICSFLDLWFSNSILPSGKSKKPSCLLVMRWTISILPEFLENYLWFSWFFIFIIIITWEKQEWWGKSSYPSCVQPLCPTRWSLVPFVICGLCFWFSISPNGRIGKVKVGENQGVCSSTSCHVDISWIISGRGNYLHLQPLTRENKGCFYWTTCMYHQKSLHLVVNSMTKNTPRILSCKRK